MKTRNTLFGIAAGLLVSTNVFSQSNQFYDGIDLTKLKDFGDTLRTSSAWNIFKIYEAKKHLIPNMAKLKDLPRTMTVPANLEEIYFANNWLEVKQYSWLDGSTNEDEALNDPTLYIPDRKNGSIRLQYRHVLERRIVPELVFLSKADGTTETIDKKGNYYYRRNHNAKNTPPDEYNVIVNYSDGILILETTYTGKVGDFNSKRRFRNVYIAIPKTLMQSRQNSVAVNPTTVTTTSETVTQNSGQGATYSPTQAVLNLKEDQLIGGDAADNIRDNFYMYHSKMPDAETLKTMRPGKPINQILEYDLYDYDWIELGRYEWYNGERYVVNGKAMDMMRFHPQAGSYLFSLTFRSDVEPATLKYLNNWNKKVTTVMRQGYFTYLAVDNQPALTVVSYDTESNMLVVDQKDPISGGIFRMVYLAVPKQF